MSETNALKVVLHWTGYGEEGTIGWYFKGATGLHTPGELTTAASDIVSNWTTTRTPSTKTQFTGQLAAAQSVDKVTVYQYATLPGPATELGVFAITGWAGTGVPACPLQVANCATLLTAQAGASFRGRQYFPGGTSVISASNALDSNAHTDVIASLAANMGNEAAQGLMTGLSEPTLDWCVYSPKRGIMTPIINVSVNNKVDTQRRREGKLQPNYTKLVSA